MWASNPGIVDLQLPQGPAVITVNVTEIGADGQFGNILSLTFNKVNATRRLRA